MNNLQSPASLLATRRSTPPALLQAPFPSDDELQSIATMGLRVPDHKKVEPWRLIALRGSALKALSKLVNEQAPHFVHDPDKAKKIVTLYRDAGAVMVMVFCPKNVEGAPKWEQHLSMGAVGVSLVNAAIIQGYGACWMTGFLCESPAILEYLEIGEAEKISGFVHMGTPSSMPPERPRPKLEEKLTLRTS